jgi:hypothetical protein
MNLYPMLLTETEFGKSILLIASNITFGIWWSYFTKRPWICMNCHILLWTVFKQPNRIPLPVFIGRLSNACNSSTLAYYNMVLLIKLFNFKHLHSYLWYMDIYLVLLFLFQRSYAFLHGGKVQPHCTSNWLI